VIPFPGISNNSFSALLGVAFTDLHCSPASLNTCLEVLEEVHRVALERNAGVLFLGDFWHHRGTLRVDCLNAVLEHFRSWEVPMIMIPGNHDQVTLGGHSHGLTPFENAYRVGDVAGPLVLCLVHSSYSRHCNNGIGAAIIFSTRILCIIRTC
jgi:predicted MPP superfamily phosphohydrolase